MGLMYWMGAWLNGTAAILRCGLDSLPMIYLGLPVGANLGRRKLPVDKGGLGVADVGLRNEALLGKWWKRLEDGKVGLWKRVIWEKYYEGWVNEGYGLLRWGCLAVEDGVQDSLYGRIPSKVSIFGWRLPLNRLATKKKLIRRGVESQGVDEGRGLCRLMVEEWDHLLCM
ncbi:hypothetical protein SLEP1_g43522 [Rubroshorea leprosula]|uniref:Reverse transcriptase zinc-binding domain-containing protein n=1 Tax=Rubroshorea leprosula TaxID=152421 RepID=A0AAV5LDR8_9ROSI|nr:hypothetical protein SLEP1_g43522 [Rubroshorea leprosula]